MAVVPQAAALQNFVRSIRLSPHPPHHPSLRRPHSFLFLRSTKEAMSFFGFDTSLPRDRGRGPGSKGFFENSDPFAQVALADKFVDGDA